MLRSDLTNSAIIRRVIASVQAELNSS